MPCSRKMLHSTCVFQKMALKVERWNPHFTLMKCCSHSHDSKVLQLFALCEMVSCFLRLGCVCTVIQCLYVFVQFETERRSSSSIKLDLENNKDKNSQFRILQDPYNYNLKISKFEPSQASPFTFTNLRNTS